MICKWPLQINMSVRLFAAVSVNTMELINNSFIVNTFLPMDQHGALRDKKLYFGSAIAIL